MGHHARSESQLPLYSSQTASSSSSSLSFNSSNYNNEGNHHSSEKQAYDDRKASSQHRRAPRQAAGRSSRSKLESCCALLPAASSALNNLVLGAGRRRPLPLLCFCIFSLFILASLTTSDEYIPDSVSASRAKLSSFIDGFRASPIRLPKAPPSSDITLDESERVERWVSPTPALPVTATLRERLQALWDAPLSEPANWVKWNSQTCSRDRVKQAQNDWITQDAALIWHSLNSTDIRKYRKGMIDYLVECEKQGLMDPANVGEGRG